MVREVLAAQRAVDAVGGDDEVGAVEVAGGGADHRGAVGVVHRGDGDAVADRRGGEGRGQGVGQGRAVQGERRAAEAGGQRGGVGAAEPAAVRAAQAHGGGDGTARRAGDVEADGVEGAQGVGGEHDPGADRGRNPAARSHTVTRQPWRCRATAAASPPIPAPVTTA